MNFLFPIFFCRFLNLRKNIYGDLQKVVIGEKLEFVRRIFAKITFTRTFPNLQYIVKRSCNGSI